MPARKQRRRPSGKLPSFVPLFWATLNSEAYKGLSPNAAKILPYFLGKLKISLALKEAYSTPFEFTYSEAAKLRFSTASYWRITKELVGKGFIDPVKKGGLRGKGYSSSQYTLSKRWERYGKPDFIVINLKEFIHEGASINS